MPDDVVVDTAGFIGIKDTVVNVHNFNCRRLVVSQSDVCCGLDTWIPSTINFQTLAFLCLKDASSDLRLLHSALMAGALKDIQIHISCEIREAATVETLTELIKMERLKALDMWYTALLYESEEDLYVLLRAAANSSQLTTLLLRGLLSADLCHLCGGVQKTWQFLSVRDFDIDFPSQTDHSRNSHRKLSHIETLMLLSEHLTELKVLVDKTIMDAKLCHLPHLPNLTVLILTLTRDAPRSFAVRDFLFGPRSFLRLKRIEVWGADSNENLSVEFVKCVSDCLEQSIPVLTCQGTLRSSHSLQLEHFLMQCDEDFLAPLGDMAAHLRNKSLSRLTL